MYKHAKTQSALFASNEPIIYNGPGVSPMTGPLGLIAAFRARYEKEVDISPWIAPAGLDRGLI